MKQNHKNLISCNRAYQHVMDHLMSLGTERVPLSEARGRYLAEEVVADRDLPPYERATMDGIALTFHSFHKGRREFRNAGMARAGIPQRVLKNPENCMEIATGAVLPEGADTVVRYEDLQTLDQGFRVCSELTLGQNIHKKGSDARKGSQLLEPGNRITPVEVSVLASVGQANPLVHGLPKVILVSSGDELVKITQDPDPHQIRKSNVHMLANALNAFGIKPIHIHIGDEPGNIETELRKALEETDVLMLSGGVSKGRYDFIPQVLDKLGVRKIFHRVAQRPGKPFWFGKDERHECLVFSFPGNPVSTFLNYHFYFRDWLMRSWNLDIGTQTAVLSCDLKNSSGLTQFRPVGLRLLDGSLQATPVPMNGSGDFLSLTRGNAFVRLEPSGSPYLLGTAVPILIYKPWFG